MEMIVFSGVQGAGKSTFYHQRLWQTHVRLSLDMIRTRNREDILLHACLAAQQPLVIDNTNPTAAQRQRYAALARAARFTATLYFFDVPLDLALARNAQRPEAARVPELAVRGAFAKLERPTRAEGFDRICRLHPAADGQWMLEDVPG